MGLGDNFTRVLFLIFGIIIMAIFPLMSYSERRDDISGLAAQTATTEFVGNVKTTGKLTLDDYEKYLSEITATGNSFDVDMLVQQLDENPGVKTTQADTTKIGENVYYNKYTSQIEKELSDKGRITLKEGDIVSVTVKNTNQTIAQMLRNFFYVVSGNYTYQIAAQDSVVVAVNGSTSNK